MAELRPQQIVNEISKRLPNAWRQAKSFRSGKGNGLPDWPDWCYIPIAAGIAIATQGSGLPIFIVNMDNYINPAIITAAAAWRVTQGIYRFDADLYNYLVNQPLDGNIPCDALKRLPEWCVYIETISDQSGIVGFWAHLEFDVNTDRTELRFVFMNEDGTNFATPIHLGDWTLEEGIDRVIDEAKTKAKDLPAVENWADNIAPYMQLVLYLCAENVDLPKLPQHPISRVSKNGTVDYVKAPKYWKVGERIGSSIRKYENSLSQNNATTEKEFVTHSSPRPHVRRAHWHHFWVGPRDSRKLVLRWLPPIPVNVDDEDNNPAVIHKVK